MADYIDIERGPTKWDAQELLLLSGVETLPTDVPAGSVAYTASMSHLYIFDGTEWQEVGGDG